MRVTDTAAQNALDALDRRRRRWVYLEDADGTMVDVSEWVSEVRYGGQEDQPISWAQIKLRRQVGTQSLAPLVEGSPLNRDALDEYAPLVYPGRRVHIYTAITPHGTTPDVSHRKWVWSGYADDPTWHGSHVVIPARDKGAVLMRRIIEQPMALGDDDDPVPVEDVMQQILDEQFGTGTIPLRVIGDPDFGIAAYTLGPATNELTGAPLAVLQALMALADLQGWALRYLWDESEGDFVLTYYEPARSNTTPSQSIGADDYYAVDSLRLNSQALRNAGELLYVDDDGESHTITDERDGAANPLTRAFVRFDERGSVIRTQAQAERMLGAIMDDISSPAAEQRVSAAYRWNVELGDVVEFKANPKYYDSDQQFAVYGYEHVLHSAPTPWVTLIDAAGKPSGGFLRWLTRESRVPDRGVPPGAGIEITAWADAGRMYVTLMPDGLEAHRVQAWMRKDSSPIGADDKPMEAYLVHDAPVTDLSFSRTVGNGVWYIAARSFVGNVPGPINITSRTVDGGDDPGPGYPVGDGRIYNVAVTRQTEPDRHRVTWNYDEGDPTTVRVEVNVGGQGWVHVDTVNPMTVSFVERHYLACDGVSHCQYRQHSFRVTHLTSGGGTITQHVVSRYDWTLEVAPE